MNSSAGVRTFLTLSALLTNGLLSPALRAQVPPTGVAISSVSSGMSSGATTNVAPGAIVTITGTNLAAANANLGNLMGSMLPVTLGGVQVTVAGRMAPLFMVSPTSIIAQIPFEITAGPQSITITNGTVTSAAFPVMVATSAPAVFADGSGGIALRAVDYSLVGAGNPAQPGELVILYATGLGQTTAASQTGVPAGSTTLVNTAPVSATINGQSTEVLYSVAAPGFAGLYQLAVRVPAGASGTVPIALQTGGASSAPVTIITGVSRGTQINAQVQAVFAQYRALGAKPLETLTPQQARVQPAVPDAVRALLQSQGRSTAPEPVARVEDRTIPGPANAAAIPVRFYTPQGAGPFPVIVYFHGGGFVIATIDTYDSSARALANAAGAIVISVEYRKAPENPFPAAVEDAYAAVQWAIVNAASYNGRPERVAVAGESAGGNLSTVVCLLARERAGRMPVYQALIYPVTNLASESRSYEENGNAPFLTRAALRWFGSYYFRTPSDALSPFASPLLANLSGLPPATVITAGFDPLRDEGAAYADKLRQAGIQVDYRNYEDMTHEFFGMTAVVDRAREAVQQVSTDLKAVFNR